MGIYPLNLNLQANRKCTWSQKSTQFMLTHTCMGVLNGNLESKLGSLSVYTANFGTIMHTLISVLDGIPN